MRGEWIFDFTVWNYCNYTSNLILANIQWTYDLYLFQAFLICNWNIHMQTVTTSFAILCMWVRGFMSSISLRTQNHERSNENKNLLLRAKHAFRAYIHQNFFRECTFNMYIFHLINLSQETKSDSYWHFISILSYLYDKRGAVCDSLYYSRNKTHILTLSWSYVTRTKIGQIYFI